MEHLLIFAGGLWLGAAALLTAGLLCSIRASTRMEEQAGEEGERLDEPYRGKTTVCLDFDGVLHSGTSGWQGAAVVGDPPTEGALGFVRGLLGAGLNPVISSSRCRYAGGADAIAAWLGRNGFPPIPVVDHKPPAVLAIDDRAMLFDGRNWPSVQEILAFEPWNKVRLRI